MQAIKEKFNDMKAMRAAKADAREEEKAEKDAAKARVDAAHEMRMAKEAEAQMDLHVNKAVEKVEDHKNPGGGAPGYTNAGNPSTAGTTRSSPNNLF